MREENIETVVETHSKKNTPGQKTEGKEKKQDKKGTKSKEETEERR